MIGSSIESLAIQVATDMLLSHTSNILVSVRSGGDRHDILDGNLASNTPCHPLSERLHILNGTNPIQKCFLPEFPTSWNLIKSSHSGAERRITGIDSTVCPSQRSVPVSEASRSERSVKMSSQESGSQASPKHWTKTTPIGLPTAIRTMIGNRKHSWRRLCKSGSARLRRCSRTVRCEIGRPGVGGTCIQGNLRGHGAADGQLRRKSRGSSGTHPCCQGSWTRHNSKWNCTVGHLPLAV